MTSMANGGREPNGNWIPAQPIELPLTIAWPPRGERGFGYDPVFVPKGRCETFGEMDPDEKHRISHRAHAFTRLVAEQFGS